MKGRDMMHLVEQHVIKRDDPHPRFAVIDVAAYKSKNLYNAALYLIRQAFIFEGKYLNYNAMDKLIKSQMEQITNKRNRQVKHYLHAASKCIIDFLVKEGVGTIIIGKNALWKQEAGMGRRNNQNFVSIPHTRLIDMIIYKAALVGMQVELQEESYTSKASFLDLDPIPTYKPNDETHYVFSGKRVKRGLYRASDGREINADVQGPYNILRKCRPNAFSEAKGVAGYVVCAQRGA
jgi:putative transposase